MFSYLLDWNLLLVFGFDFDKLNALEIQSLAILDSFCMMKVQDLCPLPEEHILPSLGNTHLFSFFIIRRITFYIPNLFQIRFAEKMNNLYVNEQRRLKLGRQEDGLACLLLRRICPV